MNKYALLMNKYAKRDMVMVLGSER